MQDTRFACLHVLTKRGNHGEPSVLKFLELKGLEIRGILGLELVTEFAQVTGGLVG